MSAVVEFGNRFIIVDMAVPIMKHYLCGSSLSAGCGRVLPSCSVHTGRGGRLTFFMLCHLNICILVVLLGAMYEQRWPLPHVCTEIYSRSCSVIW